MDGDAYATGRVNRLLQPFGLVLLGTLPVPETPGGSPAATLFESPCLQCAEKPCLAACPVNAFAYLPGQAKFHMDAFVKSRQDR